MSKKVAVIQGHPDPSGERLCHALAQAYISGARSIGSQVDSLDIARLEFPLLRAKQDYDLGKSATPPTLVPAQNAIQEANHLAIFYPLWQGTMPALLKAFFEQIFRPGVAIDIAENGMPRQLFKGKSARLIVTMGMPAVAYRWYFGAHSLKSLEKNMLGFSGVKPIRRSLFGMVENVSTPTRERWLRQMEAAGRKDAR